MVPPASGSDPPASPGQLRKLTAHRDSPGGTVRVQTAMLDETQTLHDDPPAWFTDILSRIAEHKINKIDALPLWARPEAPSMPNAA